MYFLFFSYSYATIAAAPAAVLLTLIAYRQQTIVYRYATPISAAGDSPAHIHRNYLLASLSHDKHRRQKPQLWVNCAEASASASTRCRVPWAVCRVRVTFMRGDCGCCGWATNPFRRQPECHQPASLAPTVQWTHAPATVGAWAKAWICIMFSNLLHSVRPTLLISDAATAMWMSVGVSVSVSVRVYVYVCVCVSVSLCSVAII